MLRQGSRFLARFLGEWFVPLEVLPKVAIITFGPKDGATDVYCRVTDARWNVGYFDSRSRDRYSDAVRRLVDTLQAASTLTDV